MIRNVKVFVPLILVTFALCDLVASRDAYVNMTFYDVVSKRIVSNLQNMGTYGQESSTHPVWGWLVHVRTAEGQNNGCTPPVNMHHKRWIALVRRGDCKFQDKIDNAAVVGNASAVIVYNNEGGGKLQMMHDNDGVVAIFIRQTQGEMLATMVDSGTEVWVRITEESASRLGDFIGPEELLPTTTPRPTTTTTRRYNRNKTKTTPRNRLCEWRPHLCRSAAPKAAPLAAAVTTDLPPAPEGDASHLAVNFLGLIFSVVLVSCISYE